MSFHGPQVNNALLTPLSAEERKVQERERLRRSRPKMGVRYRSMLGYFGGRPLAAYRALRVVTLAILGLWLGSLGFIGLAYVLRNLGEASVASFVMTISTTSFVMATMLLVPFGIVTIILYVRGRKEPASGLENMKKVSPMNMLSSVPSSRALPLVTIVMLVINFIAFVFTTERKTVLETFGLRATTLQSGSFWQILTPIFLHFDAIHLLMNEYGLFVLGLPVERVYGAAKTAYLYVVSGVIGNVASYFILPSYVLTLGASGAVFGLMGAEIAMTIVQRTRPAGKSAGATIVYAAMIFLQSMGPQINVVAHLAGLCFGLVAGYVLAKYSRDS
jgi:membrane associated rhomboid family serine protease